MEHVLDAHVEQPRNFKSALQRRRVAVLLDRDDGLARNADRGTQLLLRHGSVTLPQFFHSVRDRVCFRHELDFASEENDMEHVLHDLTQHEARKDSVK